MASIREVLIELSRRVPLNEFCEVMQELGVKWNDDPDDQYDGFVTTVEELSEWCNALEGNRELRLSKLKVTQMKTPVEVGVAIRAHDHHGNMAFEIRAEESRYMGQGQWVIPLRIEVGDVVIEHRFPGQFEHHKT